MKNKLIYLTIAAALLIISGCKKFLEVQPADRYTVEQVFTNENAIQQALNGIYGGMAADSLYGSNLTTTAIEMMGQRYRTATYTGSGIGLQYFQQYAYTNASVQATLSSIWKDTYANILQANQFIEKIDAATKNNIITAQHATELKGEAIGLRAFLHFDMLRLFGPVMKTSPAGAAIPYYTKADGASQPILNATQAVDSVLADLSMAKQLLSADPVITNGPDTASRDFYIGHRNQRLNYYAVVALQARVYLYAGDKADAFTAASQVLTAINKWFPWTTTAAVLNSADPDRIFSPEMLFGLYNPNMYLDYSKYFAPTLTPQQLLTAAQARLDADFEGNHNDFRYINTWVSGINGVTFFKYADVVDAKTPWRYLQPLIKKSELYYILAETDPNYTNELNYLNTVRNNRGLNSLATGIVVITEVRKEYEKEFWGEGQIYYFYKRNALQTIPSGLDGTSMVTVNYTVPLPSAETTPR